MVAPRQQLLAAKETLGQGLAPPDTTTERVSVFCATVSLKALHGLKPYLSECHQIESAHGTAL
jgi:hypothetical protein